VQVCGFFLHGPRLSKNIQPPFIIINALPGGLQRENKAGSI
jgi:hypothetical protein